MKPIVTMDKGPSEVTHEEILEKIKQHLEEQGLAPKLDPATRPIPVPKLQEKMKRLKFNVATLAAVCMAISAGLLITSLITVQSANDQGKHLKEFRLSLNDGEQQSLLEFLSAYSAIVFILSLISEVVSVLLLIGMMSDHIFFLYPWIIYHELTFGATMVLCAYIIVVFLFKCFLSLIFGCLAYSFLIVVLYKINKDVISLFIVMLEMQRRRGPNSQRCIDWRLV